MVIEFWQFAFRLQVLLEGGGYFMFIVWGGSQRSAPLPLTPLYPPMDTPMPKFGFFRYSVSQNDCIALLKLLYFSMIVFINHNPTNNHYVDMQIQMQGILFLYFTSNILQQKRSVFFQNILEKLRAICNFQGLISSLIFFFH